MDFTSFTQAILKKLQEELGDGYTVLSETVDKNNGVRRTGVTIRGEGRNIFPTVYIDGLYRADITETEISQRVRRIIENLEEAVLPGEMDLSGFTEFGRAKYKLAFKIISAEKNRKLLKSIPHRIFYNLAIVYYYTVQEPPFYGNASVLVNNSHMRQWGTDPQKLLEIAGSNTPELFPWVIDSMEEIMKGILAEDLSRERDSGQPVFDKNGEKDQTDGLIGQISSDFAAGKVPMYVLTNRQKVNGAACMLYPDVLKNFGEKLGEDFYILPSSVHELILVPKQEGVSKEALCAIVTDINRTQVAQEEVLADSVYYYSREKDKVLWLL